MGKSAISTVPFSIAWLNTPKQHGPNGMWKFPTKIHGFGLRGCWIWTGERIIYHIWFPQKVNGKLDSSDVFHLLQNTTVEAAWRAQTWCKNLSWTGWPFISYTFLLCYMEFYIHINIIPFHIPKSPEIPLITQSKPRDLVLDLVTSGICEGGPRRLLQSMWCSRDWILPFGKSTVWWIQMLLFFLRGTILSKPIFFPLNL